MTKKGYCMGLVVMVCAIGAVAETISVRLPQLEGTYMSYGTLTASFSLGESPSFIGQARIRFKGTFYPGRACFWSDPPEYWFYYYDSTSAIMDPPESQGYWRATGERLGGGSFDSQSTFWWDGAGQASWVFLLDGEGQVDARLYGVIPISYVIIQPASAYITEATLTIEGEMRLISPNGNEVFRAGSIHTIEWTDFRPGGCSHSYNLEYSTDNGINWMPLTSVANQCSYDWSVPQVDSNDCLVRILDSAEPGISDTSDEPFTIYRCTLSSDLTGDCFVDFQDVALLASEWLQCGNPFDPACAH